MKSKIFIKELARLLEMDVETMNSSFLLKDLIGWDSLAIVSTLALVEEYCDKTINAETLAGFETLGDLMALD